MHTPKTGIARIVTGKKEGGSLQWIAFIDFLLCLTTGLMFVLNDIVFLFHLIFIWLAIGAFFWNFRGFVARSVIWVPITAGMVLRAIDSGQTQTTEMIEIPMLAAILVTVFLIASRRAQAQKELELKNLELQRMLDERNQLQEALARQAFHDPLTGLPNRVLFYDRLRQALARVARYQGFVAVLFVDLDGFKTVNDRFGHSQGDQLLIFVAKRLLSLMRVEDTVARIGGDEFTILLENEISLEGATKVARRLLEEISLPYMLNAEEVFISASVGIAISHTGENKPDELVGNADQAMYDVKSNGKAGFRVHDVVESMSF